MAGEWFTIDAYHAAMDTIYGFTFNNNMTLANRVDLGKAFDAAGRAFYSQDPAVKNAEMQTVWGLLGRITYSLSKTFQDMPFMGKFNLGFMMPDFPAAMRALDEMLGVKTYDLMPEEVYTGVPLSWLASEPLGPFLDPMQASYAQLNANGITALTGGERGSTLFTEASYRAHFGADESGPGAQGRLGEDGKANEFGPGTPGATGNGPGLGDNGGTGVSISPGAEGGNQSN